MCGPDVWLACCVFVSDSNGGGGSSSAVFDGPLYTVFVSNLDSAMSGGELEEVFRGLEGGSEMHSATVVVPTAPSAPSHDGQEPRPRAAFGFVHYTSRESCQRVLDERGEVDIKGRKSRTRLAEERRKVYVRGLPRDIEEKQLEAKLHDIAGNFQNIVVRGGQFACTHTRLHSHTRRHASTTRETQMALSRTLCIRDHAAMWSSLSWSTRMD